MLLHVTPLVRAFVVTPTSRRIRISSVNRIQIDTPGKLENALTNDETT
jgi:hypothetical protein